MLALLLLLGSVATMARAAAPLSGFVQAGPDGFTLNGQRFFISGANQYNLMTSQAFGETEAVSSLLNNSVSLGLNVVRTWAFCDGDRPGALQPEAGVYSEETFVALDSVVAQAGAAGVRLVLTLSNYWSDFGGVQQYASWVGIPQQDFFVSPDALRLYLNFVTAVVTRNNSITGVAYRDDPAVFAWELMNEPRNPSDRSGDAFQAWLETTSLAIKSLDANHMVTIGAEGFYGPSTPDLLAGNPYESASMGTDFSRNAATPSIDYLSIHSYPDQWMKSADFATQLSFSEAWYRGHLTESERIGKPLVLEEFAWDHDMEQRNALYQAVYDLSWGAAQDGVKSVGGESFWLLAGEDSVPDYDGYTVYPARVDSAETVSLIRNQAQRMESLATTL